MIEGKSIALQLHREGVAVSIYYVGARRYHAGVEDVGVARGWVVVRVYLGPPMVVVRMRMAIIVVIMVMMSGFVAQVAPRERYGIQAER